MLSEADIRLPETFDRKMPVAIQVFSHLRNLILTLQLQPSQGLSEKELSVRLGVSRTPVREALIRLADEGLVDIYPQRGTFVAPIRIAEVKEARFIREALETAVTKRAVDEISDKYLERLEENLRRQSFAVSRADHDEFMILDEEFHHTLCYSVSLPRAWKVIQTVKGQLDRVRYIGLREPGHIDEMYNQHSEIFYAIKNGDSDAAVEKMRLHLQEVWETIERLAAEEAEMFEK